jgi:hypothetical protein
MTGPKRLDLLPGRGIARAVNDCRLPNREQNMYKGSEIRNTFRLKPRFKNLVS